jgi:uncharacterized repeat protein (TIGR03803 family)
LVFYFGPSIETENHLRRLHPALLSFSFIVASLFVAPLAAHSQTLDAARVRSAFTPPLQNGISAGSPAKSAAANSAAPLDTTPATVTETIPYSFNYNDQSGFEGPFAGVIAGPDGNLWGTANSAGANGYGMIFKITPGGVFTDVHDFTGTDGGYPEGALIVGHDGALYGTTSGIATVTNEAPGSLFKITTDGTFTLLYTFGADFGPFEHPEGPLVEDASGNFYGTSSFGGAHNAGFIYEYSASGVTTDIWDCLGTDCQGIQGGLLQGSDGNFYGTSKVGGAAPGTNDAGTIFSFTPGSALQVIHAFTYVDGWMPTGSLVELSDGSFWGTTFGGPHSPNYGNIFNIVPNGSGGFNFNVAYTFPAPAFPSNATLILGGDGNLYSTATGGNYLAGVPGTDGWVFQLNPTTLAMSTVYSFTGTPDAQAPWGPVTETSDGSLWGGAIRGGANSLGALFKIASSPALPPAITLTASSSNIAPGSSTTLTFGVTNAYSTTAKACYGFTNSSATGPFSGAQSTSGSLSVTLPTIGTYVFAYSCGGIQTAVTTVTVGTGGPSITNPSLPNGTVGAAYSQSLNAVGGTAPYTWSIISGSLPPGLSLSPSTGGISGTPTQVGTDNFVVQVADSESTPATATASFSITINPVPPPTITTVSLYPGTAGAPYGAVLTATGGTPPYTWSLVSGPLPPGLSLTSNGNIIGTPTQRGTYPLTIQVADSESTPATATANFTLTINPAQMYIVPPSLPNAIVGAAYSQTLSAVGGIPPLTWSLSSGSLPSGLSISPGGVISGVPTQTGISNFVVQVADAENPPNTVTANARIIVTTPPLLPATVIASATPSSIQPGQSTSISVNVSGPSGSPAPTGTVQFVSNGTNLGSPVTLANGTATLADQVFSTAGAYVIVANYSGDTNYLATISASVSLTVATPPPPATPTVTANPSTITVTSGGAASTTLILGNFSSDSVTFACSGLPQDAKCSFGAVSSSNTVVLQINTAGSSASLTPFSPASSGSSGVSYAIALPGLIAIAGLFTTRRRYSQWRRMFALLLLLSAGIALTACGGSGSTSNNTPPGTSTVTVTATAGSQTATVPVTLVVQ